MMGMKWVKGMTRVKRMKGMKGMRFLFTPLTLFILSSPFILFL
jgi:hypothetical protein